MALALVLRELSKHGGFSLEGLAHFNHRLRPTAERDEAFCRGLADALRLPFHRDEADVASVANERRLSVESTARLLRYEFLTRTAARTGATRIAVGHTQDDQAETFLLKAGRGAGLSGLAGVYPCRDGVVRPLLEVPRSLLREYLVSQGQAWVEDETNADLANPRNAVRHRVLPELERAIGGTVAGSLARAAGLAREDGRYLDALAASRFEALVQRRPLEPGGVRLELPAAALQAEPLPMRRRVVRMAMLESSRNREIGADHVECVLELLAGSASAADIPGSRVELRDGMLVLYDQRVSPK